jgi:ribosomal protein S18 acetylase RimI-like enzyme
MRIERYRAHHHQEEVVGLALRAWEPVFDSIRQSMDRAVYAALYPDWRVSQRKAVEDACAAADRQAWVAIVGGRVAGFVVVKLDAGSRLGEISMIAVDPGSQRRGIGRALTEIALAQMTAAGMSVAMVETGGDPGHEPARRLYARAGFGLLPIARFFKRL